jgi:O-6-methylguanine DNA methyltransferase
MDIAWTLLRPALLSPVGFLVVAGDRGVLRAAFRRYPGGVNRREVEALLGPVGDWEPAASGPSPAGGHLRRAVDELTAYFAGESRSFRVPLDLRQSGTTFQRRVWKALQAVPFGALETYGSLAAAAGAPAASRAVGGAVGRNPIPVILPCHRVVGSSGRLTGFSSGLDLKVLLLEHEGICLTPGRTVRLREARARPLRWKESVP